MMTTTTYPLKEVSPVDALWTLIQGQSKAVRAALTKRLVEQQEVAERQFHEDSVDFSRRIAALKDDPEGFFKLGGFMADSSSTAEELLEEALSDKYGI